MQKILIIEDDIDIQDILKNHLTDAGYEVVIADDGLDGIAKFDDTISLVLLDIMLPKIDGYGVCEVIRQRSQVPIIMLTAKSQEEDKVIGLSAGADDYVTKPFSVPELLARIKTNLRRVSTVNQPIKREYTFKDRGFLSLSIFTTSERVLPESTMSSTMITWYCEISCLRSRVMFTFPEEAVPLK